MLGSGYPQCLQTAKVAKEAAIKIGRGYGVLDTLAIVEDGAVKSAGKSSGKEDVKS